MSIIAQINPFDFFTDTSGTALDDGFIWFGVANKDPRQFPVTAYYDAALTIPAVMPLRTSNGYVVRNNAPTFLYINGNYSVLVQDKNSVQVFYVADFLVTGNSAAVSLADLANTTDPTKGISLAPTASRLVPNIATLRTLPKTGGSVAVFVQGYYNKGDLGGGNYWLDPTDTTSVDNGGTLIVAADGGRWKLDIETGVTTAQFGVNFSATDTARCQAMVNWCLSFPQAYPMMVSGPCLLTSAIMIDRLVDTTTSEFRIVANGTDSGFFTTTAGCVFFDSTIAMTISPVTEFVTFEGIRFAASTIAIVPSVLSQKYLRVKFLNCYFKFVNVGNNPVYWQQIYFQNCNIRSWPSVFFSGDHAFASGFDGCTAENGNGYLVSLPVGCYGVWFTNTVCEGGVGGLISTGNVKELLVSGCYIEGNAAIGIELGAGLSNIGVTIQNTLFSSTAANVANVNFYEINWASTVGGVSIANTHFNGRLHGNGALPSTTSAPRIESHGDFATLSLAKNLFFLDQSSGTFTLTTTLGTGAVAFANYRRNGNVCTVEFSITFSGASGSNAILSNLPYSSVATIFGGSVTLTDQVGEVYLIGGTGSGTGAGANSVAVCSTKQGAGITYTTLNGKALTGRIDYQI